MTTSAPLSTDTADSRASRLRLALCAWEIGHPGSGFGVKIGGLGHVVEELPPELIRVAAQRGLDLEIELLSPCFAHYDRSRLTQLPLHPAVTLEGHTFTFDVFEHRFRHRITLPGGRSRTVEVRSIYFWDDWQLRWTNAHAVYPDDPWMGMKLYSALGQAMAGYIRQGDFRTVHLHDYHVGLVPFFLGDELLQKLPVHLTVHNGAYQGICPPPWGGPRALELLGLPGQLFGHYFSFFDNLNPLRACILKVHERGGKVTTVSGDLAATWGYAAELRESWDQLWQRASVQLGRPPARLFLPNHHMDVFEKIPILGITNGLGECSRAAVMPELTARVLRERKTQAGGAPLFDDPQVEMEMLRRDHTFDVDHLDVKSELRGLLHREVFRRPTEGEPAILSAVGRLVQQKNFALIADVIPRIVGWDPHVRFVLMGRADDDEGRRVEARFRELAARHPERVAFVSTFNPVLAKLVMAGSDFSLIPSRFEPCGLTDYEAALLGTIPICHATGGLTKIRHCGYLYEWLDIGDWWGECDAFADKVREAIDRFRQDPKGHRRLMVAAMQTDTSWDKSAGQYLDLYLAALRPPATLDMPRFA
jgi:glycogen synthase